MERQENVLKPKRRKQSNTWDVKRRELPRNSSHPYFTESSKKNTLSDTVRQINIHPTMKMKSLRPKKWLVYR
ncbi:unnamed protein product [Onchocerca flexuosa]|uniref:Ovule protein n=1 Tax=Onchocerca flexuosa TaxID=387005 RepID=A0A183I4H3_9BILA|nr:unnamed protein product [Onchocerca flexuosa]